MWEIKNDLVFLRDLRDVWVGIQQEFNRISRESSILQLHALLKITLNKTQNHCK